MNEGNTILDGTLLPRYQVQLEQIKHIPLRERDRESDEWVKRRFRRYFTSAISSVV